MIHIIVFCRSGCIDNAGFFIFELIPSAWVVGPWQLLITGAAGARLDLIRILSVIILALLCSFVRVLLQGIVCNRFNFVRSRAAGGDVELDS
jgi:hypothetical protein